MFGRSTLNNNIDNNRNKNNTTNNGDTEEIYTCKYLGGKTEQKVEYGWDYGRTGFSKNAENDVLSSAEKGNSKESKTKDELLPNYLHLYDSTTTNEQSGILSSQPEGMLNEGFSEEEREGQSKNFSSDKRVDDNNCTSDFVEFEKEVFDDMGVDDLYVLPEGWTKLYHDIGIPIYAHKSTGIVTLSPPQFLGSADLINHRIPLSAIPCLQYRKQLEKLALSNTEGSTRHIGKLAVPIAKVETVENYHKSKSLSHGEIYEYCKRVMPLRNQRVISEVDKSENLDDCISPCLPSATKLIIFSVAEKDGKDKLIRQKEHVINPYGKGYVTVLHEFTKQAMQMQPSYKFFTLRPSSYESVVFLDDQQIGKGRGNSKKQAKLAAAKKTLEILIPQLKGEIENMCKPSSLLRKNIFDDVEITDPRVPELLTKTCEPTPYSMLLTCLRRNYGYCDVNLNYVRNDDHNTFNRYTIRFGRQKISVACKSKDNGKQKAAQAMLQQLHPHLSSWGSIIRLYGTKSADKVREKKRISSEITSLQHGATKLNSPNYTVLNKLFQELDKLRCQTKHRTPAPLPFYEGEIPNFT